MKEYKSLGISESTMKRMAEFFMKTSIPRLLEKEIENQKEEKE